MRAKTMAASAGDRTPTSEQTDILSATGRRVRIEARAGTGKTTTMEMLAERLAKRERVLYLVFGKNAQTDARSKLRRVADALTVHGLALKSVPDEEPLKAGKKRSSLKPSDLLEDFADTALPPQIAAHFAADFLSYFLNSTRPQMSDAVRPFAEGQLPPNQQERFMSAAGLITKVLKKHMGVWRRGEAPCPFDFYLKLAHRMRWLADELGRYSVLLVDEAQDLSQVMLEAINEFKGRVFVVGDEHQQIYAFRHAVNAMQQLEFEEEHSLTGSFRFNEPIARLVTDFIRRAKGDHGFVVHGIAAHPSVVKQSDGSANSVGRGGAVLARTNHGLLEAAIQQLDAGVQCRFSNSRGVSEMLEDVWDVYRLARGDHAEIRDPVIASFPALDDLEAYAQEVDDWKLLGLAKVVRQHGASTPRVLRKLEKISKGVAARADSPDVILATVHDAKGREFSDVQLCGDIFRKLDAAIRKESGNPEEEANIAYVAMTRAKRTLVLPSNVDIPSIAWPVPGTVQMHQAETLRPLAKPTAQAAAPARGRPTSAGRVSQPRAYPGKSAATPAPLPRSRLGARVQTALGPGNLVPGGEKGHTLLVQLDREAKPVRLMSRSVRKI
jgi:hypothetical protein